MEDLELKICCSFFAFSPFEPLSWKTRFLRFIHRDAPSRPRICAKTQNYHDFHRTNKFGNRKGRNSFIHSKIQVEGNLMVRLSVREIVGHGFLETIAHEPQGHRE